MIADTILQIVVYIPLILGIFLSFKLMRLTDLTADGSFVIGAAIFARFIGDGFPYGIAILLSVIGGFCVGVVLAYIQKNNRVSSIVASVLCVFMLYSVNLLIMGRPNIYLGSSLDSNIVFFIPLTVACIGLLFIAVIRSKVGLICRAFGVNYTLTKRHGYRPELIRVLGLGTSNALYAISGILIVHLQRFADVNMGHGVALIGIGSVTIGIQLFISFGLIDSDKFNCYNAVGASILGIFLYFLLSYFLLRMDIDPLYLKLILGMLLSLTFIYKVRGVA